MIDVYSRQPCFLAETINNIAVNPDPLNLNLMEFGGATDLQVNGHRFLLNEILLAHQLARLLLLDLNGLHLVFEHLEVHEHHLLSFFLVDGISSNLDYFFFELEILKQL